MTGLLTDAQREFLRGERASENPEQYRRNIRYNVRERMRQIDNDLELLDEVDEGDVREEFFTRFNRHRRLECQIKRLRDDVARLEAEVNSK